MAWLVDFHGKKITRVFQAGYITSSFQVIKNDEYTYLKVILTCFKAEFRNL